MANGCLLCSSVMTNDALPKQQEISSRKALNNRIPMKSYWCHASHFASCRKFVDKLFFFFLSNCNLIAIMNDDQKTLEFEKTVKNQPSTLGCCFNAIFRQSKSALKEIHQFIAEYTSWCGARFNRARNSNNIYNSQPQTSHCTKYIRKTNTRSILMKITWRMSCLVGACCANIIPRDSENILATLNVFDLVFNRIGIGPTVDCVENNCENDVC